MEVLIKIKWKFNHIFIIYFFFLNEASRWSTRVCKWDKHSEEIMWLNVMCLIAARGGSVMDGAQRKMNGHD